MTNGSRQSPLAIVLFIALAVASGALFFVLTLGLWGTVHLAISVLAFLSALALIWKYIEFMADRIEQWKSNFAPYMALGVLLVLYLAAVLLYAGWSSLLPALWIGYFLVHLFTLAVVVIAGVLLLWYAQYAGRQDREARSGVSRISEMQLLLASVQSSVALASSWSDSDKAALHRAVSALIEKVRFSDPMATGELMFTDMSLTEQIRQLSEEAGKLDVDHPLHDERSLEPAEMLRKLQSLSAQVDQRNARLLVSK